MKPIYLDYNATTPCAASVVEAMAPFWLERFGNPSCDYPLGRISRAAIEEARAHVAELLGCDPDEVIFTSGGTESNNLAITGVMFAALARRAGTPHFIISAIEHPAVTQPAEFCRRMGVEVTVCPCDQRGVLDLDAVVSAFRPETCLVSTMHANNEVGAIQPIAELSRLCRGQGILLHTDAAQTVGKLRTNVDELGVDLLTLAAHKFYGPKGVGALYIRRGTDVEPVLRGAGQESGLRPGTEHVPLIVGLGAAARLAAAVDSPHREQQASLRDRLWSRLQTGLGESLHQQAASADRLPNTLSISLPGISGRDWLGRAPEIAASVGSACHSHGVAISATLQAMQVAPELARGTIRLSVGWPTSTEEIDRAADLLIEAASSLRERIDRVD